MLTAPEVLLFVPESGERAILEQILVPHASPTWVSTSQELIRQLDERSYSAVFCACNLSVRGWREILQQVHEFDANLPVIMLSPTSDEKEWAEALKAGAFDLLCPPYSERMVLAVLAHAVATYEARLRHDRNDPDCPPQLGEETATKRRTEKLERIFARDSGSQSSRMKTRSDRGKEIFMFGTT